MAYTKTIWENSPSEDTPISAENLNNIENGISGVDTRLTTAENDIDGLDTRLTTAEGEIDTTQTDINNAEAVIGNETDTYSASSKYALGSLVIYNSLLYKCTTAITVAEAWNSAKWTQVSLTSLANDGDVYSTSEQVIGKWIDGKHIFRKILTGTYTGPTMNIGTISNVDKFISFTGTVKLGNIFQKIGGYFNSDNYSHITSNNGVITLYTPTSWNNATYHLIVEYTKTS